MIVPLEYVRLKAPVDSHDQRAGLVLDAAHGWECALDEDKRFILLRHKETWTAEIPVENAAHWRRAATPEPYSMAAAQDSRAKGKKR